MALPGRRPSQAAAKTAKRFLVFEMSTGQMVDDVQAGRSRARVDVRVLRQAGRRRPDARRSSATAIIERRTGCRRNCSHEEGIHADPHA
ncbi:MAG: hypothetical protein MZU95_09540 [Desulfomicrobium escambiense]|nr:hypothetical protein [Desulfomicrobium escambiense]